MRKDDRQLGTPYISFVNTKAFIQSLPNIPEGAVAYASDTDELGTYDGSVWTWGSGGGTGINWGEITGTLADQVDLQNALDAKIAGVGVVGRVAEFVTDTKTIQAAKIIAPAVNILTILNSGAAKSITFPGTANDTVALLGAQNTFADLNTFNIAGYGKIASFGAAVSYEVGYMYYDSGTGQFRLYGSPYGALGLYSQANKDIVLVPGTGKVSMSVTNTAANAQHTVSESVARLTQTVSGNFNNYGLVADIGFSLNTGITNTLSQIGFIGGINVLAPHLGTQGIIIGLQPTNTLLDGAGGVITTAMGVRIFPLTYTGTVTTAVTNVYGVKIETPTFGGGTLANIYGLYLENQTGAATLNYAIVTNAGNIVFNEGGDANTDFRVESDTEANMVFLDASADTLQLGGTTNSTTIAKGGRLTMTGTARVNKSIILATGILGSGGSSPALAKVGNTAGYKFAVSDEVYLVPFEVPYDWDSTTDLIFKVHLYSTNTTASRFVKFQIDYNATAEGTENVNAATTTTNTGDITLSTTAYRLTEATATLAVANFAPDDVLSFLIKRIASVGTAPASPADNPVVMSFEIEYISNKLGE